MVCTETPLLVSQGGTLIRRTRCEDQQQNMDTAGLCTAMHINPLKPNDTYSGRTPPLTNKSCILYIYSTNIGTEYFKLPVLFSPKCSVP